MCATAAFPRNFLRSLYSPLLCSDAWVFFKNGLALPVTLQLWINLIYSGEKFGTKHHFFSFCFACLLRRRQATALLNLPRRKLRMQQPQVLHFKTATSSSPYLSGTFSHFSPFFVIHMLLQMPKQRASNFSDPANFLVPRQDGGIYYSHLLRITSPSGAARILQIHFH